MRTERVPTGEVRLVPRELAGELAAWATRAVSLAELVRLWFFRRCVELFILATLVSAALLPYRQAITGSALTRALVVAGVMVGVGLLMRIHSRRSYELLSRSGIARGTLALLAAALISVVFPLHSQLWVPACGVLCLLALFVPLRRIAAIDLLVLLANLAAHAISGDLGDVRPVAVIGLWVGIPFWTILISIAHEGVVDHILGLCLQQPAPNDPPLRVDAWVAQSHEVLPARSVSSEAAVRRVDHRLTFRQKEAVRLLLRGLRNYEIAKRLAITPEQASRLISRAVKQAGAQSKEQLSAMLAREWWYTGPSARTGEYRPDLN